MQGMDLTAQYMNYQQEVQREFLKICSMKSESRKFFNNKRLEDELEVNPESDTVSIVNLFLAIFLTPH